MTCLRSDSGLESDRTPIAHQRRWRKAQILGFGELHFRSPNQGALGALKLVSDKLTFCHTLRELPRGTGPYEFPSSRGPGRVSG